MNRFFLALACCIISASAARPHYNMLLPSSAMVQKGDKVTFLYQFGHPFERELSDAPRPGSLELTTPDGKSRSLLSSLEKFKTPGGDGKDVDAFRFAFTPEQRGDHWFVLTTPPIWFPENEELVQDIVQVVLHVQTQNGWDRVPGKNMRLAPLTRPYGLLPGVAFQAQVFLPGTETKVLPSKIISGGSVSVGMGLDVFPRVHKNTIVEIEHLSAEKPKAIPMDEFITLKARTDPNGVFISTLAEPGWWCMTAQHLAGKASHQGKEYPLRERVTLWVHVDAKAR